MWSSSVTLARPVRTPASSFRKSSTAFSIRARAWAIASLLLAIIVIALCSPSHSACRDCGTHLFAHDDTPDVSRYVHFEDDDRHPIIHAKRDGSGVHDSKALLDHFEVRNAVKHLRAGHFLRIRVINSIDSGGLQNDVRLDFHGAQCRRRVGREIGVAGTCGENDDPAFLEVAHGAPADERFGHLMHLDRALQPRPNALLFESIRSEEHTSE